MRPLTHVLQKVKDFPHAVDASVVAPTDLDNTVSALGTAVRVDLDPRPGFLQGCTNIKH